MCVTHSYAQHDACLTLQGAMALAGIMENSICCWDFISPSLNLAANNLKQKYAYSRRSQWHYVCRHKEPGHWYRSSWSIHPEDKISHNKNPVIIPGVDSAWANTWKSFIHSIMPACDLTILGAGTEAGVILLLYTCILFWNILSHLWKKCCLSYSDFTLKYIHE